MEQKWKEKKKQRATRLKRKRDNTVLGRGKTAGTDYEAQEKEKVTDEYRTKRRQRDKQDKRQNIQLPVGCSLNFLFFMIHTMSKHKKTNQLLTKGQDRHKEF